jgi:hypothetical protein
MSDSSMTTTPPAWSRSAPPPTPAAVSAGQAFAASDVVGATLVQFPNRNIDCADERWDENAMFIAHTREDVPRLIAEIRGLNPQNRHTRSRD